MGRDRIRFEAPPDLRGALTTAGLDTAEALVALAVGPRPHSVRRIVERPIDGTCGRFYLKAYAYPRWHESLGLAARGTLWGRAPCVTEFHALTWLRAHDLPAVRPIAAASIARRGRLLAHAILTEWVDDAPDLATWAMCGADDPFATEPQRSALARALGGIVGRMHAAGFHHRDLFPRNVLARPRGIDDPSLWLLDCRRGGVGGWRRRARYDLACLLGTDRIAPEPFRAAYDAAYPFRRKGSGPRAQLSERS